MQTQMIVGSFLQFLIKVNFLYNYLYTNTNIQIVKDTCIQYLWLRHNSFILALSEHIVIYEVIENIYLGLSKIIWICPT